MIVLEALVSQGVQALIWDGERLRMLDQRRLPAEEVYLTFDDADSVATAIREEGGQAIAVISHRSWVNRFSSDPAIVGSPLTFDGQDLLILSARDVLAVVK